MFVQSSNLKVITVLLVIIGFVFFASACIKRTVNWKQAHFWLEVGDFAKLTQWTASVKKNNTLHGEVWLRADSLEQIAHRVKLDFMLDEVAVDSLLLKEFGEVNPIQKKKWEDAGLLEHKYIDGKKRYFKRAFSNLKILLNQDKGLINDPLADFCLQHTQRVIEETKKNGQVVLPQSFKVEFSLRVNANAVPDGEEIRCWLPFPKELHARQTKVELVSASEEYNLSNDTNIHRTIYMTQKAQKDMETIFTVQFNFTSSAQYFQLSADMVHDYHTKTDIFKHYTKQQFPHIVFSDRIKQLSDSIVGTTKNPLEKVQKLYYWIDENIPWAGALEYGTISCIPEYVLDHKKGDCGMQTLLFMTMARYQGVPVKWQSGWMMHPGQLNLHDWCEVYYQGVGWVPLDRSFNLQNTDNMALKEFYITGIDAYRLIINDGIGAELKPRKNFLRSEPWDFQRGEVEWAGGNLYFDLWDYSMKVLE